MNPFWVVSNSFNSRYAPYRSSSPIAIYNKGGVDINSRWIVVSCWQSVVMLVCKIPIVLIRSIVKIVLSFNNSESSFCMCGLYIPINVDNCLQTSISDSAAFSEEGRHLWVISSSSTNRSGNCRVRDRLKNCKALSSRPSTSLLVMSCYNEKHPHSSFESIFQPIFYGPFFPVQIPPDRELSLSISASSRVSLVLCWIVASANGAWRWLLNGGWRRCCYSDSLHQPFIRLNRC